MNDFVKKMNSNVYLWTEFAIMREDKTKGDKIYEIFAFRRPPFRESHQ